MKFVYHIRGRLYKYAKKSLNISKVLSETVNRRTDNTMYKIKDRPTRTSLKRGWTQVLRMG